MRKSLFMTTSKVAIVSLHPTKMIYSLKYYRQNRQFQMKSKILHYLKTTDLDWSILDALEWCLYDLEGKFIRTNQISWTVVWGITVTSFCSAILPKKPCQAWRLWIKDLLSRKDFYSLQVWSNLLMKVLMKVGSACNEKVASWWVNPRFRSSWPKK